MLPTALIKANSSFGVPTSQQGLSFLSLLLLHSRQASLMLLNHTVKLKTQCTKICICIAIELLLHTRYLVAKVKTQCRMIILKIIIT
jgi:hypothetical protein